MNSEEVRRQLLDGIDSLIEAPKVVAWMIKPEKMRLLRAMRAATAEADDVELARLGGFIDREPMYHGDEKPNRAHWLECIVQYLEPDEAARLAANILDRFYGQPDGYRVMPAFRAELSDELAAKLVKGVE